MVVRTDAVISRQTLGPVRLDEGGMSQHASILARFLTAERWNDKTR